MQSFAAISVILLSSTFAAPTPSLYSSIYDSIAGGLGRFSYGRNLEAVREIVAPVASHDLPIFHSAPIESPRGFSAVATGPNR